MCIYLINIFDSNGSWLLLWGLSLVLDSRGYSSLWCLGLSLQWLLLWSAGSEHMSFSSCSTQTQGWGSWAPEHRLSICGTWAQFWGMGDLPEPGIKPVSPALVGEFLTTGPQQCIYVNPNLLIYPPIPSSNHVYFLCLWVYFCVVNKLIHISFFRFHI